MEILAHRSYRAVDYDIHFWRTKAGLEVDFVLGRGEVAIEVKGSSRVDPTAFRSLRARGRDVRGEWGGIRRSSPGVDRIEVMTVQCPSPLWSGDILS